MALRRRSRTFCRHADIQAHAKVKVHLFKRLLNIDRTPSEKLIKQMTHLNNKWALDALLPPGVVTVINILEFFWKHCPCNLISAPVDIIS